MTVSSPATDRCEPQVWLAGDPAHGVDRCAHELAGALSRSSTPDTGPVHVHFTDRLYGASPAEAAAWLEGLAARRPVTVTLHDLPQASDGSSYLARRDCYARVVAVARGVVCNSEHERALLARLPVRTGPVTVIPLAMPAGGAVLDRPATTGGVGLLGFFYPGKGHDQVVAALAALAAMGRPQSRLIVLGRASTGHEGELRTLVGSAGELGVAVEVTGYLSDDELVRRARQVAVPVVAHEHVSASGSLNSWIASGRRPLVRDGRYTQEMAALRPGTLTSYDGDRLAAALAAALDDPNLTWLDDDAVLGPRLPEVAAAYRRWWAEEVTW